MRFLTVFFLSLFFVVSSLAAETYNCTYTRQQDYGVTATSTKAVVANARRRCLIIQNKATSGASTVLIKFGSAHTGIEGFFLPGNSTVFMPIPAPIGSIYLKAIPAGGFSTTVIEGE